MKHGPRALAGMGGCEAFMVVVVGLLSGACSSSATPAGSSGSAYTSTSPPASWSTVDLNTGTVTPLRASDATSGAFYVVSPDGSRVAYNPCCNWETPTVTANLDGTQVHAVSAEGMDGVGEQWSPDGSQLVYQQRDGSTNDLGNLFVQDIATGRRTRVTNLDRKQWGWWFTFPSFSPNGKSILYQLPEGHRPNGDNRIWDLWSAPAAGGKPTLVRRNAAWGDYSPDGKWLAYLSSLRESDFTGATLWIRGVDGGAPQALVRGGALQWVRWSPDGTRIAYSNASAIYVVNILSRQITKVAKGGQPEWQGDHTLIFSS